MAVASRVTEKSFVVLRLDGYTHFLPLEVQDLSRNVYPRYTRTEIGGLEDEGGVVIEDFDSHEFLVFADRCEEAGLGGPILDMLKRLGGVAQPIRSST